MQHTYMHAIRTKRRLFSFSFLFLFSFFLFQGEEKEERSGRLSGEGPNTYLPTYLAVLVEEEEISILFFL